MTEHAPLSSTELAAIGQAIVELNKIDDALRVVDMTLAGKIQLDSMNGFRYGFIDPTITGEYLFVSAPEDDDQ